MANAELSNLLSRLTGVIEPLARQVNLAYWNAATTGEPAAFERFTELQVKLQEVFSSPEDFGRIRKWRDDPRVTDPLARRQVELLYNDFLRNQVDPSLNKEITRLGARIENQFNVYRGTLDGRVVTTNDITEILRRSLDVEVRRKAWEAGKHVGSLVHADLLRLVRMRNEAAQSLGYDDFYAMSLDLDEQNESDLEALFVELEELTRGPFAALKGELDEQVARRYGIESSRLRPWHYDDLFFQEAPRIYNVDLDGFYRDKDVVDLVRQFFRELGLDVDDILQRSDLYERAGKDQHAFCTDIDRRGDIRILANVKNDEMWAGTMLHELGHAVYDKYIDPQLPFTLRKHAHTFVTEAIAMMFGRLSKNPRWIGSAVGKPGGDSSPAMNELSKYLPLSQLVFTRWAQVMVRFERALYRDPNQDLNGLWWDLVTRFQLVTRPEERDSPDWAAKMHVISAPVYYHNYVLGEMLASQLSHHIHHHVTPSSAGGAIFLYRVTGEYLKDTVFSHGARYRWDKLIEKATGEPLSPKYFVEELTPARLPGPPGVARGAG